jgi:hypothetical protein
MWTVEHSAETNVEGKAIWEAWSDVSRWPEWNPDIDAVELRGEFAGGSTIAMRPIGADTVELSIVDAVIDERFVDEASLGGTTIRTTHEIQAVGGGRNRVVYRLEATGPAADELGPAISADFPETIAGLLEFAGRAVTTGDAGQVVTAGDVTA